MRRVHSSSRIIAALRHVTDTSLSLRISDTELQTPAEQQHITRTANVSPVIRYSLVITRAVQPVATRRQSPYLHKPATVIVASFPL